MLTLAAIAAPVAKKHDACHTHACRVRVASKHCTQRAPRWCVEHAIAADRLHGWMAAWMRRVPGCESSWNPYAYYGAPTNRTPIALGGDTSRGLFEFKPSTWQTTPYRTRWIFSARYQSLAAGWMIRQGRSGEWTCR